MATVDIIIASERGAEFETQARLIDMVRESQCFCGGHAPWACNRGKHSVNILPTGLGKSVVHYSRNKMFALALYGPKALKERPPADYFLLVDDDMVMDKGDLNRMLTYKPEKRVITGISVSRRDPVQPNIRDFNEETRMYSMVQKWDFDSNKLFEIAACGAAFMLVPRLLVEEMAEAYLKCWFERLIDKRKYPRCDEVDTYWDAKSKLRRKRFTDAQWKNNWEEMTCQWFEYFADTEAIQVSEHGEDITFCWKARQMGYRIFADPQITPGHLGRYAFSVDDYRQRFEAAVEDGIIKKVQLAV